MPAHHAVGPVTEHRSQFLGADDFDLIAKAQNPVQDFIERLNMENKVECATRSRQLEVTMVIRHIAKHGGQSGAKAKVHLELAIAMIRLQLGEKSLELKPGRDRVRLG